MTEYIKVNEHSLVGRVDWPQYYLKIARAVSERAECLRRKVGCVIVTANNQTIISTGYNGAPPKVKSCLDGGCPRALSNAEPGKGYANSGCIAIHAEANAIIRAGKERCEGSSLFVNSEPCELCVPLISAAGIAKVYYPIEKEFNECEC